MVVIYIKEKQCKDCKETKPIESFNPKEKINSKGEKYIYADPRCRECRNAINRKKYRENPQRQIEATKRYYRNNREERIEYQKKLHREKRLEYLNYQTSMYWKNVDERRETNREYREENKDYFNQRQKERTEMYNALPNDYWWDNFEDIFDKFQYKCSITDKEDDITIDHFIPITWGHGGTYKGNLIVIDMELNKSKGQHNPFEWIKKDINKNRINKDKWNQLTHNLAKENGLTIEEFENFVYWCEMNKRTVKEIKLNNDKRSLDLWREYPYKDKIII
jgi:hypothetical protein